ncbi:MAG: pilus assembly protein PilM [Sedimentisphaerales bacterium]|nr:pilus assembly protein PilM [Sedimentisphaerales bacterium]
MSGSKTVLGIDITGDRINMALLKKQGDKFKLLKVAEGPVPEGSIKKGNIENPTALAKAIKMLQIKNRIYANRTAISLVANPVLAQILDLPNDVTGNVRQFINNEVKHYAVLPIKKATLDFCKIKSSTAQGNRRALIIATDGQKISDMVKTLYQKGISIDVIEPSWMAYARACFDKKISKINNTNLLFAIINKDVLTLSLFKDQKLDFVRVQPIEQVETGSEMFMNWLAEQINAVMKFYEYGISKQYNKWQINVFTPESNILSNEKDNIFKSMLSDKITLSIHTPENAYLDTPIEVKNTKKKPSAVAIGLAMKLLILSNDDLNINLVPSEAVIAKSREHKTLVMANIAAALIVIVIISAMFFNTKIVNVKASSGRDSNEFSGENTQLMLIEKGQLDKNIKQMSEKINDIMSVIKTDSVYKWSEILSDIGSAIPKNNRLTSIGSNESGILLNGQALTYDAIYLFVDSLNKCKTIELATIVSTTNNAQSNRLVNYSIRCVLTQ